MFTKTSYGYIPDGPRQDSDIPLFGISALSAVPENGAPYKTSELPRSVNLGKGLWWFIYNQGGMSSCVANAAAAAFRFACKKQGKKPFDPSRLFIYWTGRSLDNRASMDAGMTVRSAMTALQNHGVPPSIYWPYLWMKLPFASPFWQQRPPERAFSEAEKHQAVHARYLNPTLDELKACHASGHPFVFGFTVYNSLHSPKTRFTGNIEMPEDGETSNSGHAMLCYGYDDDNQVFLFRNSWGFLWGKLGHGQMSYEFMTKHTGDHWAIIATE